jgi:hypothetical protein
LIEISPPKHGISVDLSVVSKSLISSQPGTNPSELSCVLNEQDEISKVVITRIEIFFI